jgi:hypothetical protein
MDKHEPHFVEASVIIEEANLSLREQLVLEANLLYKGNIPKADVNSDGFIYNEELDTTTYFVLDSKGNTQAVFGKGQ